ncbi:4-alpha-glucanotransferase [Marinobacter sp. F4206]|uniref:4-alpha-glucanotransferase n=1 Tax=Marinobacter sp. F4206 TaxID=2861777 RepID=UPI001C5D613D|nr:4-alpha-glucanotransferase [Marinobacter sp. F4206]MBW4933195.1 4-alpha-glucanotransferase [Marinobacter sp. F4206]
MTERAVGTDLFSTRRAGVLLHPTCLPGTWGVLGQSARNFVDFLASAGIRVWQTLPIGPTHSDLSPYQSLSAHAGNPDFIDLSELILSGLLDQHELDDGVLKPGRQSCFELAAQRFFALAEAEPDNQGYRHYLEYRAENDYWLDEFSLFITIREFHPGLNWLQWPTELRDRHSEALAAFAEKADSSRQRVRFEQFLFYQQWQALRHYAHERDIRLFGDIPIFVAHDSADVWANRHLFKLDSQGQSTAVAGVPPDYFSPDGQHWGNPLYDWEAMAGEGYEWWLQRLDSQRHLFDLIRIDHFRGLEAYWEIPAESGLSRDGYWVAGPGREFLEACFRAFPELPLVAENLGVISDEVEELRRSFHLPGMTVLQFGFDGNPRNPHLTHNHEPINLVYTGTHDNDTTLGWYESLDDRTRHYVNHYLGSSGENMPWPMIQAAFRSVSSLAIVPMQDLLGLGTEARFNTPGTIENNWLWKLDWQVVPSGLAGSIRELAGLYGRLT